MDLVDNEFIEKSNSDIESEEEIKFSDIGECETIDELDLQGLKQIPDVTIKEVQILEEFILEVEIEFWRSVEKVE